MLPQDSHFRAKFRNAVVDWHGLSSDFGGFEYPLARPDQVLGE
jgi:hypothetical protein